MARQVVVLAILLLAVVQAYVAVADTAPPSPTDNSDDDLAEPPTNGVIGTLDEDAADSPAAVLVAPMGGPVPPGAFDTVSGSSDASSVRFSSIAGAAALAAGVIYF